jgi:hypothetical protein
MVQQLIQSFMRQLQSKNSQGFQQIQNMMSMGQNPEPYVKQVLSKMNSEQKANFFKQLNSYRVSA